MSKKFPHYWICDHCAKQRGGRWPEGHVATLAKRICEYCNGNAQAEEFIAPWVDFDWEDPDADTGAKLGRD